MMSKIQRNIAILFLVISLAALALGAYLLLVPAIPPEFAGETKATITDIAISYDSPSISSRTRDVDHTVMVAYEVDGKQIERELGAYTSGMYTGQVLDIQYDVREPGRISLPGGRTLGAVIALALGAVFGALGLFLMKKPVPVFLNGKQVA